MDDAYTDTGTLLPPDSFAIVIARDGECQLCVPKMGDDELMPEPWLAATMAGIKFMRDPQWVADLVEEFSEARDS
jgi:hypothetical protein